MVYDAIIVGVYPHGTRVNLDVEVTRPGGKIQADTIMEIPGERGYEIGQRVKVRYSNDDPDNGAVMLV